MNDEGIRRGNEMFPSVKPSHKLAQKKIIERMWEESHEIYEVIKNISSSSRKKQFLANAHEIYRNQNKRLAISPDKVVSNEQLIMFLDPPKNRLQMLKRSKNVTLDYEEMLNKIQPFTKAISELDQFEGSKKQKAKRKISEHTASINMYRSIPKKGGKKENKSASQTHVKMNNDFFFTIQKIGVDKSKTKVSPLLKLNFKEKRRIYKNRNGVRQKTIEGKDFEKAEKEKRMHFALVDTDEGESQSLVRMARAIKIPFDTFYYRDMIWKINYSNCLNVEVPNNYEHRLKVFIGKGNNSRLLRSLITRRIWLGITDRIEEANFAWTQLKSVSYIELQDKCEIQETTSEKCEYEYSEGLLSEADELILRKYSEIYRSTEERIDERFLPRNKYFKYRKRIKVSGIKENRMHNHFINNYVIGNKKALLATMIDYFNHRDEDVFEYLPVTFHVEGGLDNPQYKNFLKHFYKREEQEAEQMWIVKPGENSNRGNGIKVCLNLDEIKEAIKRKEKHDDRSGKTYIIQEYVQNPLLYKKRKFDIRHFVLITCVNGIMKGYWYKEGYARTSSFEYKKKQNIGKVHLTNDAIQKSLPEYGKYEKGNKLSYDELEEYLWKKREKVSFKGQILPKMKQATRHLVRACSGLLDPSMHQNNFELFGLDFLLDNNYKVYLIEANSNPCLEISSPLISTILPKLIENTLEITLDTQLPPPVQFYPKGVHYFQPQEKLNQYSLIYDSKYEAMNKGGTRLAQLQWEGETFDDDGDEQVEY